MMEKKWLCVNLIFPHMNTLSINFFEQVLLKIIGNKHFDDKLLFDDLLQSDLSRIANIST